MIQSQLITLCMASHGYSSAFKPTASKQTSFTSAELVTDGEDTLPSITRLNR